MWRVGDGLSDETRFDEDIVEAFEELFAELGDGDFLDDDLGDLDDEACDLRRADDVGGGFCELIGIESFEHPGGGSPVASVPTGSVNVVDVDEFGGVLGECDLFGKLRITFDSVGEGLGVATDGGGGSGSAATGFEKGENEGSLVVVEEVGAAGVSHRRVPFFKGWGFF